MNEAIKLAIEKGGYKMPTINELALPLRMGVDGGQPSREVSAKYHQGYNEAIDDYRKSIFSKLVLFDPLFWQALGKVLKWEKNWRGFGVESQEDLKRLLDKGALIPRWQYHALRFFELKFTGGDEEKFWEELLK